MTLFVIHRFAVRNEWAILSPILVARAGSALISRAGFQVDRVFRLNVSSNRRGMAASCGFGCSTSAPLSGAAGKRQMKIKTREGRGHSRNSAKLSSCSGAKASPGAVRNNGKGARSVYWTCCINHLMDNTLCLIDVGFLYTIGVGFLQEFAMRRSKTLRERIETRIARKRGEDVFLPREFRDLGGEDQVLRVLRILVREKRLVRLGYGVYGRAIVSRLSGDPILYSRNGFLGAVRQALTKLGVIWEPSEAERDYNAGRSTQVPLNPVVRVKGRFSRRLRDGKQELVLAQ